MTDSHTAADSAVLLNVCDGIANIRFNCPAQMNAVDATSAVAFDQAVLRAVQDSAVKVIVLSGAGRAFMAGGDLAYFRNAGERAPQAARQLIDPMHAAILRLAEASQPVLASLHGAVAGAGMSLALAADLAIAADDVRFNLAYMKVGNSPDCSGSWTLPRLVGLRKALEITLLADNVDAHEALRLGLVNRVVPRDRLEAETHAIASRLAGAAPFALAASKRLLREGLLRTLAEQLDAEARSFAANAGTADFREALAAFFEKRAPQFEGK